MDRAEVIDHLGGPGDPYRVTIMRLARKNETYELRWRENERHDDGSVTRERRTGRGGYTKPTAYTKADKVYHSLERTNGYLGDPDRQKAEPKAPARPPTFRNWLGSSSTHTPESATRWRVTSRCCAITSSRN